jgi:hypothetical protein
LKNFYFHEDGFSNVLVIAPFFRVGRFPGNLGENVADATSPARK